MHDDGPVVALFLKPVIQMMKRDRTIRSDLDRGPGSCGKCWLRDFAGKVKSLMGSRQPPRTLQLKSDAWGDAPGRANPRWPTTIPSPPCIWRGCLLCVDLIVSLILDVKLRS